MDTSIFGENFVVQNSTFHNGLRVVSCTMPHMKSISISVEVGVGSRYETPRLAGASHFLEHMLFKGTADMPDPSDINELIESGGGVLNASTEYEVTSYWCRVALPYFRESLQLIIDLLRNSLLEPEDIEKERMVIIEELNMINDQPTSKVESLIDEMLWPDNPMGRDIGGTKESVNKIDRDDLVTYYRKHYSASNIVIAVAGNVSHSEVVNLVDDLCRNWDAGDSQELFPASPVQSNPQVRLQSKRTEQSHLAISLRGLSVYDPDRYIIDLISVILGGSMSSRLFVEVREKRGLAYDIQSGVSHYCDSGIFTITAGVDSKRLLESIDIILNQIAGLKEFLPEEELEKSKKFLTGRLMLSQEDTRSLASFMGNQMLVFGKVKNIEEIIAQINSVTAEDVLRIANNIFKKDRLNLAVVGPNRSQGKLEALLTL